MKKTCNEIEFRCEGAKRNGNECNTLLFKYKDLSNADLEIKCNKCGTFNIIRGGKRQNNGHKILEEFSKHGKL